MGATGARRARRGRGPATAAPHLETLLWRVGIRHVAGVDEVGMGPLAGPVVAAAVVFPPGTRLDGVADSKVLTAAMRERLDVEIRRRADAVGIGVGEPDAVGRPTIYPPGPPAPPRGLPGLAPSSRPSARLAPRPSTAAPSRRCGPRHGVRLIRSSRWVRSSPPTDASPAGCAGAVSPDYVLGKGGGVPDAMSARSKTRCSYSAPAKASPTARMSPISTPAGTELIRRSPRSSN